MRVHRTLRAHTPRNGAAQSRGDVHRSSLLRAGGCSRGCLSKLVRPPVAIFDIRSIGVSFSTRDEVGGLGLDENQSRDLGAGWSGLGGDAPVDHSARGGRMWGDHPPSPPPRPPAGPPSRGEPETASAQRAVVKYAPADQACQERKFFSCLGRTSLGRQKSPSRSRAPARPGRARDGSRRTRAPPPPPPRHHHHHHRGARDRPPQSRSRPAPRGARRHPSPSSARRPGRRACSGPGPSAGARPPPPSRWTHGSLWLSRTARPRPCQWGWSGPPRRRRCGRPGTTPR